MKNEKNTADGNMPGEIKVEATAKKGSQEELEALRARVAELEAEKAARVEKTAAAAAVPDDPEELVDYTAPLIPQGRDLYVAVNGENIVIKRGVTVKIKRKFAEALQNAQEQEYSAYRAEMQAQSGIGPLAEM